MVVGYLVKAKITFLPSYGELKFKRTESRRYRQQMANTIKPRFKLNFSIWVIDVNVILVRQSPSTVEVGYEEQEEEDKKEQ